MRRCRRELGFPGPETIHCPGLFARRRRSAVEVEIALRRRESATRLVAGLHTPLGCKEALRIEAGGFRWDKGERAIGNGLHPRIYTRPLTLPRTRRRANRLRSNRGNFLNNSSRVGRRYPPSRGVNAKLDT